MHIGIYDRLIEVARTEPGLTTYSDIAPLADLSMDRVEDRAEISRILEEILQRESAEGRPLLTALVVHRGEDNNPGEGFFAAAARLGRFGGSRHQMQRLSFWVSEVNAVHEYWRRSGR